MTQCSGVVVGLWHQAILAYITVGPGVMVWGPFTALQRR